MTKRKKILAMAYAVSPYRGSEYNVAWEWITHMSKHHDLTVLYGMSDAHMGDNETLEKWLKKNELPHVRFVFVKPNRLANWLNWLNRHDLLVYTFYFAFEVWQKCALRIAKQLVREEHFDLVHMVGPIGYREPGYLWKLGLPYVWGPIGGANNATVPLMKHLPLSGKVKQTVRTLANTLQLRYGRRVGQALRHTDILLTATTENQQKFRQHRHKDSIYLPENSIAGKLCLDEGKFQDISKVHLLFVGRIDSRKNIYILLEAMAQMEHRAQVCLDVIGGGPEVKPCRQYAEQHGIADMVAWHGQLPREQVLGLYRSAHLHLITSISEGNPTVIWEAMANGVPTLSFDHCGMHDTLRGGAGILLPVLPRYEENVKSLARALDAFATTPGMPRELAMKTLERARECTWEEREITLNEVYEKAINMKK